MAKKEAKLNSITVAQQLEDGMWGIGWEKYMSDEKIRKSWLDMLKQSLALARNGDIRNLTYLIKELMEQTGHHLRDCYGILHSEDVREVWSPVEGRMVVEKKPIHGHWVLYFKQGCGGTYTEIATILGLPVQQIEKTKPGRYGYDNSLAYLVHVKYADKHQYDPSAVYTATGRPYTEIAQERWEEWLKGRASVTRQKALNGIDDLEQRILDGGISYQQIMLTDEYYQIYARNKRRCDDAFEVYLSRKAAKMMQALDNHEFYFTIFFFTGRAGDGKTYLAKKLAANLIAEAAKCGKRWEVYQGASSNSLDDYKGQEIVWLDDVRGSTMSAPDWLKLLDPENATPNSARWHNKQVACRCILITSTVDVMEFFRFWRESACGYGHYEMMDQFIRRIQSRVQVIRSDTGTRVYRINDTAVRNAVPSGYVDNDLYNEQGARYCFTTSEMWCDLDDTVSALTERVVMNNPDVWGKESSYDASMRVYEGLMLAIQDEQERKENENDKDGTVRNEAGGTEKADAGERETAEADEACGTCGSGTEST